ncbi:MarR family winged helix-turn-helix transcriptional regulator [Rhizobacter sp. Root404]|uniref:MarR family winged helix-turn-helix transcriptional regulator n=1 Tax=Rhizobacter sp. Root404 TaxID=1736528 RepID=UPI003529A14C
MNNFDSLAANKLGALWAVVDRALESTSEDHSRTNVAVLLWLRHWAPVGVVELAKVIGLSQPACSRAVDRLVERGLVDRSEREGREVDLCLSTEGCLEADRLQRERLKACDSLLGALSQKERVIMAGLLDKVLGNAVVDRAFARNVCRFCDHSVCDGPDCPVGSRATEIERGF